MSLVFRSLSGSELITLLDDQFELSIETPDGRKDVKLSTLVQFANDVLAGRVTSLEQTMESLGLDPENPRTITVNGDVEGTSSLMDNNVVLTLNVPDGALTTAKVAGLASTLLGLRLDVDDALDQLTSKLNAADPAVAAHKLQTPRLINGVLFDGTQDIVVGLTSEQQEQLGQDKTYVHNQTAPDVTWNITHNLGKHPSVTIVDSAGTPVVGGYEYVDLNNVKIDFAGAMAGKAYLN
jgi:hypothetical protein